mmetsp:Transcript_8814/g.19092  ORF Transcript_8814/g.19092 Transcript_8814/m.19092 type:complete len:107 (+) Transcript_8814:892-1212(+)
MAAQHDPSRPVYGQACDGLADWQKSAATAAAKVPDQEIPIRTASHCARLRRSEQCNLHISIFLKLTQKVRILEYSTMADQVDFEVRDAARNFELAANCCHLARISF